MDQQHEALSASNLTQGGNKVQQSSLVVFAAASLSGASKTLESRFETLHPEWNVLFNLDGTQMLKQKVEQGAYADIFISASNQYTEGLKSKGYLSNDSVQRIAENWIIIILPASNPANISTISDLARPGIKIAIGTPEVPVGMNTRTVLDKLANSTYGSDWRSALLENVRTLEVTEPSIVTKVQLGEVDAGFVYESSFQAAPNNILIGLEIPKPDNALQTYTAGVMNESKEKDGAIQFISFLKSPEGQEILVKYGFRPAV
jgi:molybdate transport system substrate-binding protein